MSRVLILTIVIAFMTGQNLSVFCGAWCEAHDKTHTGCHHVSNSSISSIGDATSCQHTGVGPIALSGDDMRRDPSTHGPIVAVVIARLQVPPLSFIHVICPAATARPADHVPPLSLPLRI
jgi:hypothetical protein